MTEREGNIQVRINLDWGYEKCEVHLSMLDYIAGALKRFHHITPKKPQD